MREQALVPIVNSDEVEHFRVLIDARTRHADLWPLVKKLGSAKALCAAVGLPDNCQNTIGSWINLKDVPRRTNERHMAAVEALHVLLDKTYDEMWPPALINAIHEGRAAQRKDILIDTTLLELVERQTKRLTLPDPRETVAEEETRELRNKELDKLLRAFSPRERQIIELRWGLGKYEGKVHTFDEVGRIVGVTRERIRQIEYRVLRKMKFKIHFMDLPLLSKISENPEEPL